MRSLDLTLSRPVSVVLLTLTLIGVISWFAPGNRLPAVRAQSASPSGSYGFLLNASVIDAGDGNGGAIVGVMNLDGAGSLTGKYTVRGRGGPEDRASGALTGTYSTNPGGTGTLNLNFDIGFAGSAGMVLTDGGKGLLLLEGLPTGGDVSLRGTAQSLTGELPLGLVVSGAAGAIPLSLTGTSNGEARTTVYTAAPTTSSGTAQCEGGRTGNWGATLPSLTVASRPDIPFLAVRGGRLEAGNFLLPLSFVHCGNGGFRFLTGRVSGTVNPGGATTVVLHFLPEVFGGIAKTGQTDSLNGAYGFQLNYSPFPAGTVGVMKFDGAGNATASLTSVGLGRGPPVSRTLDGPYSISPDGTGTISLKDALGDLTFSFVTTDDGSGLLLLQTTLSPRGEVAFGSARRQ